MLQWFIGSVTILLFPFTLVLMTLYAVFIRIPHWLGVLMCEWFKEIKEKCGK
jgi:hypothetical protein